MEQEFKQDKEQEFKLANDYKSKHIGRRVSPRGMIDLPLDARLALGFIKDKTKELKVKVAKNEVILSTEGEGKVIKPSPRGLLQLPLESHKILCNAQKGRYNLEIDEKRNVVYLRPT